MAFLPTHDLSDDACRALLTARERRLRILKELRTRIEKEEPRQLPCDPEDLIREDRER